MELKNKKNRRDFLKNGALLTGGMLIASGMKPFSALVYATNHNEDAEHWYGMAIDIEKCIGCGNCAKACKIENDVPEEPFFFRTWVEQYTILNDGSKIITSENGGLNGASQDYTPDEIFKSFFVPKMCNHCTNSPCTQVCPVGATFESPEGVALVDSTYCIGCRYCVQACPYGCRYIHPKTKIADKCTLCYHRITNGQVPACQEVCPTNAKIFGDLNDRSSELVQFIKKHDWQILKPHMNTKPKVVYNALSGEVN
ncbi:MAG: 4Fe-4S dicluster domain-containing protein [Bacteroidetes bacterium]|jgi:tetrathionate reductase subunit B|nr:4Fe-4S dicluster domain-containing protein [Bacteroidota bacterium]MBT3749335.1 4Fe-4S dicluster domain-containing protein [Bacteroidota bacterium]MBT4400504.1 4Fe-4S dicluster domain-containing protein [Bacteroidota bacterium]MBT4411372.1 4Fe-4S dicluster domain-containing protein [Bacteroidota bacterium]MBT5425165.1 4Fe-4S dicluster domain-containing protein [Bacteroidota bacterium]